MAFQPTWALPKGGEPTLPNGTPKYFHPSHNTWLETTFNLPPGHMASLYHRNLAPQAANLVAELRVTGSKHNVHTGEIVFPEIEAQRKKDERRWIMDGETGLERQGAVRDINRNSGERVPGVEAGLRRRGAVKEGIRQFVGNLGRRGGNRRTEETGEEERTRKRPRFGSFGREK